LVCHTLTVGVSPAGSGTVEADPPPNCTSDYVEGTVVTLTAAANTGYNFDNWTGAVSSTDNPLQLTINTDKDLTAHFTEIVQICYALTVTAEPLDGGYVQANPVPNCEDDYLAGTVVTLTAVAHTGYSFSHWNGDISGIDNPYPVTMDASMSIEAYFGENFEIYLPLIIRNLSQ
jgi:hypothetical protein